MCNAKQSVTEASTVNNESFNLLSVLEVGKACLVMIWLGLKVFGQGTAADCRKHVQKLNMMRGQKEKQVYVTVFFVKYSFHFYWSSLSPCIYAVIFQFDYFLSLPSLSLSLPLPFFLFQRIACKPADACRCVFLLPHWWTYFTRSCFSFSPYGVPSMSAFVLQFFFQCCDFRSSLQHDTRRVIVSGADSKWMAFMDVTEQNTVVSMCWLWATTAPPSAPMGSQGIGLLRACRHTRVD